ncbi:DNA polymerase [Enterococcus phage EF_RCK]|nr:DNA polymerase [Enterococcus phage EF_RCK]
MPNGSVILDPIVNAEGKVVPKNDRNKLQANAKAMKKIAKAVDEVQDILDYKDLTKHLTAFVNKIDTFIAPDGKLHGQFNQFGTVTRRFSASNPNLQQQPKKARKMFEAPEGSLILGADFS